MVLAIFPLIARPGERAFQRADIAHPRWPTMLGKLAIMDGSGYFGVNPDGLKTNRQAVLLRQFAKDIAVLTHDPLGHLHLFSKGGVGRGQPNAIRRL